MGMHEACKNPHVFYMDSLFVSFWNVTETLAAQFYFYASKL